MRSPTPPLMSPPLGTPGNPIVIEDGNEELDRLSDDFYTAESTFSMPVSFLLHCQECTNQQHILNVHNTYAITAIDEHQDTECLTV